MAEDLFSQDGRDWFAEGKQAKLRKFAIGGGVLAALIVIGGGGWEFAHYRTQQANAAASARYFEAAHTVQSARSIEKPLSPALNDAQTALADLAAHGPATMRGYAGLQLATLHIRAGEVDAARTAWRGIEHDGGIPLDQRQLATLLDLESQLGQASPQTLHDGFQTLSTDAGPWRAMAREQLAGLDVAPGATPARLQEGRRILTQLVEEADTPDGVRERAQALLQTLNDANGGAG